MTRVRLGEIASVFNGKTPAKSEQRADGHPVLKIKDVDEFGVFRGRFASFVDSELAKKFEGKWIKEGDTLILNAAHNASYVGSKICFADAAVIDSMPTGEWLLVRPDIRRLHCCFLHYWLQSPEGKSAIRFLVKGIHLYPKDVATMSVPCPALTEQARIVDLLSRAENIVRMRREAEAKAKEIVPALFVEMFAGGNRARAELPAGPRGPEQTGRSRSGSGEPWPVQSLRDVAEVVSGVAKGRKLNGARSREVPYLRVANVQAGHLDLSVIKVIEATEAEIQELRLKAGDVLLTEGGDHDKLGRGALLEHDVGECIHQNHVFRVRVQSDRMTPEYFASFLQTDDARNYFQKAAKKTTNLASINMTQLRALPVVVPPLDLQATFAAHYRELREIASDCERAAVLSEQAFLALLARVFGDGAS